MPNRACLAHDRSTTDYHMYKLDRRPALRVQPPGRSTAILPGSDVPDRPLSSLIPDAHSRPSPPPLPELGELDVVRHYTNLSTLNMSIDSNFYPLGSCTMKYNPKRNERLAALPGLAAQHPYQDESTLQGLLAILFDLQEILAEIAGLRRGQPAAGGRGAGRADGPAGGGGLFPRSRRDSGPRS